VVLRANKTGAFMKTKLQNNDVGGRIPLNDKEINPPVPFIPILIL